jgi:2-dehydro-3-deoxyphosphogluconate aldolase/(4S)-4-hydroxy-2-oxoglutarate aldolase
VNIKNLEEYLSLKQVIAVGGTWVAKKDAISAKKWDAIRDNAREAVAIVKKLRS